MDLFIWESNHMPLVFLKKKWLSQEAAFCWRGTELLVSKQSIAVIGLSIYAYRRRGTDNSTLSSLKQGVAAARWSHKEGCSQEGKKKNMENQIRRKEGHTCWRDPIWSVSLQIAAVAAGQKIKHWKILNNADQLTTLQINIDTRDGSIVIYPKNINK